MGDGEVWEWAVRYVLGHKRCGSRGWLSDKWRAVDQAHGFLSRLPDGTPATGHVTRISSTGDAQDSVTEQVAFTVTRTKHGEISWSGFVGGDQP